MENELYHHGIKGMKWGVRRYQNKDGSLTKEGRKKLGYSETARKAKRKVGAQKASKKSSKKVAAKTEPEKPRQKSISEMSDAELKEWINRKNMERQAYDLNKQIAALNPKKVSKGQKFLDGLTNDVLVPAAKDIGKQYLTKILKEKLGLNEEKTKDIYAEMQKEIKNYNTQKAYNKIQAEKAAEAQEKIQKAAQAAKNLRSKKNKKRGGSANSQNGAVLLPAHTGN